MARHSHLLAEIQHPLVRHSHLLAEIRHLLVQHSHLLADIFWRDSNVAAIRMSSRQSFPHNRPNPRHDGNVSQLTTSSRQNKLAPFLLPNLRYFALPSLRHLALQRTQQTVSALHKVTHFKNRGISFRNSLRNRCVHCSDKGLKREWGEHSGGWEEIGG